MARVPVCGIAGRQLSKGRTKKARSEAARALNACKKLDESAVPALAAYQLALLGGDPECRGRKFGTKARAWGLLFEASELDPGSIDTALADARYLGYKLGRNRKPGPWEGGETDSINEALGLKGKRRVSGVFEGYEKLTVGVRTWEDLLGVIQVLREVPGLEDLRLPVEAEEALIERRLCEQTVVDIEDEIAKQIDEEELLKDIFGF